MSEELSMVRNLVDFGMMILLWLVQLVIYPSFSQISSQNLVSWHRVYTQRVSLIIVPLMFGQLALSSYLTWTHPSPINGLILLLVVICWLLTFRLSVPLHTKIQAGEGDPLTLRKLVVTNWPRTALWTAIFLLGFFETV